MILARHLLLSPFLLRLGLHLVEPDSPRLAAVARGIDLEVGEERRGLPLQQPEAGDRHPADLQLGAFPEAKLTYAIDDKRQGIVDSWPAGVDDSAARHDWGFSPTYDLSRAFSEYLIPTIRRRYQ